MLAYGICFSLSVVSFKIEKEFSNFILFQDCFGYLGSLAISYEFEDQVSVSAKKGYWNL